MANWGIKVSKPGYDVKTCTDDQLVMSSKLNIFKVAAIGSTSGTYNHGLSYAPTFISSQYVSSGKYGLVGFSYNGVSTVTTSQFNAGGVTTKYYLFYHQVN
jgi:hypothetical protein